MVVDRPSRQTSVRSEAHSHLDDRVLPYTGSDYVYTVQFHLATHVRGSEFILDMFDLVQVYPDWTIGTTIVFIYRQLG